MGKLRHRPRRHSAASAASVSDPDLRADYRKMAPMMFDDPPPTFDDILTRIAALEKTINGA
jgi:hypothetical protein